MKPGQLIIVVLSSSVVASLISAVVSFITQRSLFELNVKDKIRQKYLEKRFVAYEELWELVMMIQSESKKEAGPNNPLNLCEHINTYLQTRGLFVSQEMCRQLWGLRELLQNLDYKGSAQAKQVQTIYLEATQLGAILRDELGADLVEKTEPAIFDYT